MWYFLTEQYYCAKLNLAIFGCFLWLKCLVGNSEMKNGRDAEQVIECSGAGKLTERLAA
jgi:hypothetical protein